MTTNNEMLIEKMKPFIQEAWRKAGYIGPTIVQNKTYAAIEKGMDMMVEAPTGSGKTLAYLIPLLQKIDPKTKQTQVMVLASSHELVMQINQEIKTFTMGSDINSLAVIGAANIKRQIDKLKKKPQIIVGTPGRILELIKRKKIKAHELRSMVLDEADQLFIDEHKKVMGEILKATHKEMQLMLFSATLPETLEQLMLQQMSNPDIIRIKEEETNKPTVDHLYIVCDRREKIEVLRKITAMDDTFVLAFMRDIGNLNVFAEKLSYQGRNVGVLHSDQRKEQRAKAIKEFRQSVNGLLLATDVAARGLDIHELNYVVQMDVAKTAAEYTHRAGRTGRLGSSGGTVITVVANDEVKRLEKIAATNGIKIKRASLRRGTLSF